jgi:hypothetical protein
MSYVRTVATRSTTDTPAGPVHEHPRGRGFSILSRLAREQQVPAEPAPPTAPEPAAPEPAAPEIVLETETETETETKAGAEAEVEAETDVEAEADPAEWTAPVLFFDRAQPQPRHRRDVDVEAEDFDVSAVPVARRSS